MTAARFGGGLLRAWAVGLVAFCLLTWLSAGTLGTVGGLVSMVLDGGIAPADAVSAVFSPMIFPVPGIVLIAGVAGALSVAVLPRRSIAGSPLTWAVAAAPAPVLAMAVPTLISAWEYLGWHVLDSTYTAGWFAAGLCALVGGLVVFLTRRALGGTTWDDASRRARVSSEDAPRPGPSARGHSTWPGPGATAGPGPSSPGSRGRAGWLRTTVAGRDEPDLSDGAAARRFHEAGGAHERVADAAAAARARLAPHEDAARASYDRLPRPLRGRLEQEAAEFHASREGQADALRARAASLQARLDAVRGAGRSGEDGSWLGRMLGPRG